MLAVSQLFLNECYRSY